MKRSLILAAFMAVFVLCVSLLYGQGSAPTYNLKNSSIYPDLPKINGFPSPFIPVASGTGTTTQYLQIIPLCWDPASGKLFASGSPLIVETTTSATSPASFVLSSETINLISTIASITARLLAGINVATFTPSIPSGTNTLGSVTLTIPPIASQVTILVTSTSQQVVLMPGIRFISFDSTGTFQLDIASTTVNASTVEVLQADFPCLPSYTIGIARKATATDTDVTIRMQGGY